MPEISLTTANYAGRALGHDASKDGGVHAQATIESTTGKVIAQLLSEIKAAGFEAVDVWMCHCDWQRHADDGFADQVRDQVRSAGLRITSYAGGASVSSAQELGQLFGFMEGLGAPMLTGILWGLSDAPSLVQDLCLKYDLRWARENHFEASADDMLFNIGAGRFDRCGIALDTGWCAKQELDALEIAKAVREHLFVVHLKDMRPSCDGSCILGEGTVPVEKIVRYLVETEWDGVICLEHEPLYSDPMPEVAESLRHLRAWLAK